MILKSSVDQTSSYSNRIPGFSNFSKSKTLILAALVADLLLPVDKGYRRATDIVFSAALRSYGNLKGKEGSKKGKSSREEGTEIKTD